MAQRLRSNPIAECVASSLTCPSRHRSIRPQHTVLIALTTPTKYATHRTGESSDGRALRSIQSTESKMLQSAARGCRRAHQQGLLLAAGAARAGKRPLAPSTCSSSVSASIATLAGRARPKSGLLLSSAGEGLAVRSKGGRRGLTTTPPPNTSSSSSKPPASTPAAPPSSGSGGGAGGSGAGGVDGARAAKAGAIGAW